MKDFKEYINEASETRWVAIEVTTNGDSWAGHGKPTTSQRVVSYETYKEMKEKGYTKGHMEIVSLDTISPVCRNKDDAMSYLDTKEKTARKSPINKGNADYIVYAISSGKMNPSGATKWDWNFWEEWKELEIYIGKTHGTPSFLMGVPESLKVGDKLCCVDNDTQKKLTGAPTEVLGMCKCNLEAFQTEFRKLFADRCKKPSMSFGRKIDGLPWQRMGQFYSIKGISE